MSEVCDVPDLMTHLVHTGACWGTHGMESLADRQERRLCFKGAIHDYGRSVGLPWATIQQLAVERQVDCFWSALEMDATDCFIEKEHPPGPREHLAAVVNQT